MQDALDGAQNRPGWFSIVTHQYLWKLHSDFLKILSTSFPFVISQKHFFTVCLKLA